MGAALMALTLSGMLERFEWRSVFALMLQSELLLTGLFGWCPIYWACRIQTKDSAEDPSRNQ